MAIGSVPTDGFEAGTGRGPRLCVAFSGDYWKEESRGWVRVESKRKCPELMSFLYGPWGETIPGLVG